MAAGRERARCARLGSGVATAGLDLPPRRCAPPAPERDQPADLRERGRSDLLERSGRDRLGRRRRARLRVEPPLARIAGRTRLALRRGLGRDLRARGHGDRRSECGCAAGSHRGRKNK